MKLSQLVMPILLFAIALRRKIERNLPLEYGEVKREILSLFTRIEAEAAAKALSDRWARAKIALVYLIDEIAIMERWPGSEMWNNHSLEVEYLGHNEKMRGVWFFDREYAHAMETGDADLMEILYSCLCLGFEGRYRGQTAQLRNQIDNLYARLPIPYRDSADKLFPGAYYVDSTSNDPRAPLRMATVAIVFFGILLTYLVVNHVAYRKSVGEISKVVNELLERS